jgi:hypothetical protein
MIFPSRRSRSLQLKLESACECGCATCARLIPPTSGTLRLLRAKIQRSNGKAGESHVFTWYKFEVCWYRSA